MKCKNCKVNNVVISEKYKLSVCGECAHNNLHNYLLKNGRYTPF